MTKRHYTHKLNYRLRLSPTADERAPGGAVTVGLCGHWDHEGPCHWPHFSSITEHEDGFHDLLVEFDAPEHEIGTVKAKIDAELNKGHLTGPDGRLSSWEVTLSPEPIR